MQNLYSRLFRYRSRPDREPLEDFLTESLCDLLLRMPRHIVIEFLTWAFETASVAPHWETLAEKELSWDTQVAIPGGILDLVLYADGEPIVAVESKTWSGFRAHHIFGEAEASNQVTTYCNWLSEQAPNDHRGMLLITGTSFAPEGFHAGETYAIESRAQVTWAAVGRWLRRRNLTGSSGMTWTELADELCEFLKEKRLSSEIYTDADVAAAYLMLPSMDRWYTTFATVWTRTQSVWGAFLNPRVSTLSFHVEGGLLWQWRYGKAESAPAASYVAFGLRFPEHSNWYEDVSLPDQPHFVLIISRDRKNLEVPGELPDGWVRDEDGDCLFAKPVHEFSSDVDARLDEISDWASRGLTQARELLGAARR